MLICPRPSDSLTKEKELSGFNTACFELGGYVPVGDASIYEMITEKGILDRIKREMTCENVNQIIEDVIRLIKNGN